MNRPFRTDSPFEPQSRHCVPGCYERSLRDRTNVIPFHKILPSCFPNSQFLRCFREGSREAYLLSRSFSVCRRASWSSIMVTRVQLMQ